MYVNIFIHKHNINSYLKAYYIVAVNIILLTKTLKFNIIYMVCNHAYVDMSKFDYYWYTHSIL